MVWTYPVSLFKNCNCFYLSSASLFRSPSFKISVWLLLICKTLSIPWLFLFVSLKMWDITDKVKKKIVFCFRLFVHKTKSLTKLWRSQDLENQSRQGCRCDQGIRLISVWNCQVRLEIGLIIKARNCIKIEPSYSRMKLNHLPPSALPPFLTPSLPSSSPLFLPYTPLSPLLFFFLPFFPSFFVAPPSQCTTRS